jgi:hypothetical protein
MAFFPTNPSNSPRDFLHYLCQIAHSPMLHVLAVTQADDVDHFNDHFFVGCRNPHEFPGVCAMKFFSGSDLVILRNLIQNIDRNIRKADPEDMM